MSGRITPTLPEALAVVSPAAGAEAALVGGLSRLQAAVTSVVPPSPPSEPPESESSPQAARPTEPMSRATPKAAARCRGVDMFLLDRYGRIDRPVISGRSVDGHSVIVKS